MILGLELTVFLCMMTACLFWLLRPYSYKAALITLITCNVILLALANTILTFYLAAQVVLIIALFSLHKKIPEHYREALPWLSFLGLIPMNIQIWFGDQIKIPDILGTLAHSGFESAFWSAGASFFVIKSFVSLKEAIREKKLAMIPTLASLTFIPSFTAGPIFGTSPFRHENIADKLRYIDIARSFMQFGWGAAALYYLAPKLHKAAAAMPDGLWGQIGKIYLNFAALFFDFSGYSLMAIALGTLFGLSLPQNFNRPYLATSIREFWQRWHMSLSWFVSTYLFKPFVRNTGSPRKGIFLAFMCVGIWHKFTIGYLLWGVGHGAALSLAMKPPAMWNSMQEKFPNLIKFVGWFLTMTWVALLSHTASVLS